MPIKQKELVIYDLDGTLVDSAEVVYQILNEIRFELNQEPLVRGNLVHWISLGGEELIKHALDIPDADIGLYLNKFRERYYDMPTPDNIVYPVVIDCLESLKSSGIKLAICTNKPRKLAEKVLKETGLLVFFDFVNAGGDLPTKKPSSDNINVCLNYFNTKSNQAILIGDSTVDQQLAANACVQFGFYAPGYNDGVNEENAHIVLNRHIDLLDYLKI